MVADRKFTFWILPSSSLSKTQLALRSTWASVAQHIDLGEVVR